MMRRFTRTNDLFDYFGFREEMKLPCVFAKHYGDDLVMDKTVTESIRTMIGDTTFSDLEKEEYLSEKHLVIFNIQVVPGIDKW